MKVVRPITAFLSGAALACFAVGMTVFIVRCLLAQPVHAQSPYMPKPYLRNAYCESVRLGDPRTMLLDIPGCVSGQEDTLEKVWNGVEGLKHDLSDEAWNSKFNLDIETDLRGRAKELESKVESQATLLDEQRQQIEDLQKQIDMIRAGLVPKPRNNVKRAATPQKPGTQ